MRTITCSILFSLFALLGFTGCFTPQPVVRVQPDEAEISFWHYGQAIAAKAQDGFTTRAAFSHANRDYLVFDVECINESEQTYLVTPEVMRLVSGQNFSLPAVDPEKYLLHSEVRASRAEADAKNAAVATGVVAAAAIVAVALSDNDSDNETEADDYDSYTDYGADDVVVDLAPSMLYLGASAFHEGPILSHPVDQLPPTQDILFWSDYTLRRTTVRPGESVRGLVAFPRHDEATVFTLQVPVDDLRFEFLFQQRLIRP